MTHNTAEGGQGKYGIPNAEDGFGVGGGLYIASGAAVVLDAFTLADRDIHGTYTLV